MVCSASPLPFVYLIQSSTWKNEYSLFSKDSISCLTPSLSHTVLCVSLFLYSRVSPSVRFASSLMTTLTMKLPISVCTFISSLWHQYLMTPLFIVCGDVEHMATAITWLISANIVLSVCEYRLFIGRISLTRAIQFISAILGCIGVSNINTHHHILMEGGYAQPVYAQPAYGQPSYAQPAYGQPSYAQPGYSQPNY